MSRQPARKSKPGVEPSSAMEQGKNARAGDLPVYERGPITPGFAEAPQPALHGAEVAPAPAGLAHPGSLRLTLGPGGRVVIPAPFREAMNMREGDTMLAWVEGQELHMVTTLSAMRRARELVQAALGPGAGLVDDLVADRRRDAQRENADG
jgi:AbrB family looped-hinge helix DNA binding protein